VVFARGKGGGFLDADDVVFEAEVGIDVLFALKMAEDNPRAVGKGENAARGIELVGQTEEEAPAEVLEAFEVGFADFAEQEAFEPGHALAIIHAHLGEEPEGFAAAARAAKADGRGTVGQVAEAGRSAGVHLPGLKNDAGADEVLHLIRGTAGEPGGGGEAIGEV
jgi:hypothetical protein